MHYNDLKAETKERRRTRALREPAKTKERVNDIAMRATTNNPVSVLALGKVTDFVRHCIMLGADDNQAVEATRKFIEQLNGNPVR